MQNQKLLAICYNYSPEVLPTAIRSSKLLERLCCKWKIEVLTAASGDASVNPEISRHYLKNPQPVKLLNMLRKLKLDKLITWLVWPDDAIFWVLPAILKSYRIIKRSKPNLILVFMMPYSAGLVGVALKKLTGLPLIINFDDSLSCTDMHPDFPSRLHFWLARWLEDLLIRNADQVIYVSRFNLELVRQRQPLRDQAKFKLLRYGADPQAFKGEVVTADTTFEVVYIGGMSGWYEYYHPVETPNFFKKLYRGWSKLGVYRIKHLNQKGSSPVPIGQAVKQVIATNTGWQGRLQVKIYGNNYGADVVERLLQSQELKEVVKISGPVPHSDAIRLANMADLLLIALPARLDGSPGGRISAKTYEYLMTDKPILAAVPKGENWNYLQDKPGVWLVEPTDVEAMARVVQELAAAKFAGAPLTFDRSHLRDELSYDTIAAKLDRFLAETIHT